MFFVFVSIFILKFSEGKMTNRKINLGNATNRKNKIGEK